MGGASAAATTGSSHAPRWRPAPTTLRAFVYGLVALQLVQGVVVQPRLTDFSTSYWMVTYDYGFVRRGLAGTLLQGATGPLSSRSIAIASWLITLVAVISVIVLIEALVRRRTDLTAAMAVLVAASPFTIDYFMVQRRPDLLAAPILVALGFILLRAARWRLALCGAVGLALAVAVVAHEGTATYTVPWALVMVCVLARARARRRAPDATSAPSTAASDQPVWLFLAVGVPPLLAIGFVLAHLDNSTIEVANALLADNPWFHGPRTSTMFVYLTDSLTDSIERVRHMSVGRMAGTFAFGAVLVALQVWWMSSWSGQHLVRQLRAARPRVLAAVSAIAVAGGTILLFVSALDWLRWFAAIGGGWMIASAFMVLADSDGADVRPSDEPVDLPRWLPVAAILLAGLMPLTDIVTARSMIYTITAVTVIGAGAAAVTAMWVLFSRRKTRA